MVSIFANYLANPLAKALHVVFSPNLQQTNIFHVNKEGNVTMSVWAIVASGLLQKTFQAFWLHCVCLHGSACHIAKSEGLYLEGLQMSSQALWLFIVLNMQMSLVKPCGFCLLEHVSLQSSLGAPTCMFGCKLGGFDACGCKLNIATYVFPLQFKADQNCKKHLPCCLLPPTKLMRSLAWIIFLQSLLLTMCWWKLGKFGQQETIEASGGWQPMKVDGWIGG